MTYDEILEANKKIVIQKGTNVIDLRTAPLTVDGFEINEAVKKSSKADVDYFYTFFSTIAVRQGRYA